ncbi:hypothetical protein ACNS7O_14825 (plasmid) [Haloferacaceae archaeon DSL9]
MRDSSTARAMTAGASSSISCWNDFLYRRSNAAAFEVPVAELMFQQMSTRQVLDVFEDSIETHPTPESIAVAETGDLAKEFPLIRVHRRTVHFERTAEQLLE